MTHDEQLTGLVTADSDAVAWKAHLRATGLRVLRGLDVDICAVHIPEARVTEACQRFLFAVDGVANVGVYQRADRFHAHGRSLRKLFDAFVARHPERFDGATIVGRTRTWALPLAMVPGSRTLPGLWMAGDAGNFVDPLAGEGIWQALHSGALAGSGIAGALGDARAQGRAASTYRRRCTMDIGVPSMVRMGVQDAMDVLVASGLHRRAWVRAVLARGYGSEHLEASKRLR